MLFEFDLVQISQSKVLAGGDPIPSRVVLPTLDTPHYNITHSTLSNFSSQHGNPLWISWRWCSIEYLSGGDEAEMKMSGSQSIFHVEAITWSRDNLDPSKQLSLASIYTDRVCETLLSGLSLNYLVKRQYSWLLKIIKTWPTLQTDFREILWVLRTMERLVCRYSWSS